MHVYVLICFVMRVMPLVHLIMRGSFNNETNMHSMSDVHTTLQNKVAGALRSP